MKQQISILAVFIALFALATTISSCEKDKGKLPNIAFKTGESYTSADKSIASTDSVLIGITASKSEGEDVLKTLNISASVNGAASTTVANGQISIPSAQEDSYSGDFTFKPAATSGNTIKYTFTVTNRDGLTNAVSLTLTTL